jgi:hypothetical protein
MSGPAPKIVGRRQRPAAGGGRCPVNTQESITLRLSGTDVPPGEIALTDLASIAGALQLLATRIGRQLVGQTGPGRTAGGAERATRLTLTGITEGSTRLQVTAGAADTLDMDDPFEEQVMDRLWEVFGGLESGVPPDWATAPVAQAAIEFVGSVGSAARECEFTGRRGQRVRGRVALRPQKVNRDMWATLTAEPELVPQTGVTGDLDLVDLRTRKFRVRDAVGNDVVLEDVRNAVEAAALVGQRVRAVGTGVRGARGQIAKLVEPHVSEADMPAEWLDRGPADLNGIFAARSAPSLDGVPGVDDAELEALLADLRS